ncbi:hypothetical protein AOLI_G00244630 [Acnodon oligacanthus]
MSHPLELHPHNFPSADGLQQSKNFCQPFVPHLLQLPQKSCFKEHLHSHQSSSHFNTYRRFWTDVLDILSTTTTTIKHQGNG